MMKKLVVSEETLQKHTNFVCSVVYFEEPIDKIVSCSDDKTFVVWDGKTYKMLAEGKEFESCANSIIKWRDSGEFMISSNDHTIKTFSFCSGEDVYQNVKVFRFHEREVWRVMKLKDDIFLSTSSTKLNINSYSQEKVLRSVEYDSLYWHCRPLLSKMNHNCFYVNIDDASKRVVLQNYETLEVLDTFDDHGSTYSVNNLGIFQSKNYGEVLVVAGNSSELHFYERSDGNRKFLTFKVEKYISATTFISDVNHIYAFIGEGNGSLSLLEICESDVNQYQPIQAKKIIPLHKLHENQINEFAMLPSSKGIDLRFVSASHSGNLVVFGVHGIPPFNCTIGKKSLSLEDLLERIMMLKENIDGIFFEKKDGFVMRIVLRDFIIDNIFKSFLY